MCWDGEGLWFVGLIFGDVFFFLVGVVFWVKVCGVVRGRVRVGFFCWKGRCL